MPGFAPTQGHIASAVPFLGHAVDGLRDGSLQRVMLLAKGSLFLGRMTQMADGMSLLLECNVAAAVRRRSSEITGEKSYCVGRA